MGVINIKQIINETVEEYFNKSVTFDNVLNQSNFQTVYQVTPQNRLQSIFTHGYSREFTGSNAGNMYGAGIYTTYSLKSTQKNCGGYYGNTIIKILVPSYNRFFICNKTIAQQVYGDKYRLEDQLNTLFKQYQPLLETIKQSKYYNDIVQTQDIYTSRNVQALLKALGGLRGVADPIVDKINIKGFIFKGHADGEVAVIRDFKCATPVAYSTDKGLTFKTDLFSKELFNKVQNEHDPIQFLGRFVNNFIEPQNYRLINGFMRVQRKYDGKYNFVYKPNENNRKIKYLLPRNAWLDNASDMDENQRSKVYIKKLGDLYLDKNGFYENQNDTDPIYTLNLEPTLMFDEE